MAAVKSTFCWAIVPRGLALAGCLLWSVTASAHHSTAAYDYSKKVVLHGVVRNFQWTNPHNYLQLIATDGPDNSKGSREWSIECGTPAAAARVGWTSDILKPGDQVTVEAAPRRDGTANGTLQAVTLPDGRRLTGAAGGIAVDKRGVPLIDKLLPSLQRATPATK